MIRCTTVSSGFKGSWNTITSRTARLLAGTRSATATLHARYVYVVQFTIPLLGYPAVYTNHGVDLMVGGAILLMVLVGTLVERERRARRGEASPERSDPWHVQEVSHSGADGDAQLGERVRRDVTSNGERPGPSPTVAVRGGSKAAERERPE